VRHYDEKLPRVLSDPLLLHQVFFNMVMNAEHAIAATGRPGRIDITTAAAGDRVVATVHDTGGGIPPGRVDENFRAVLHDERKSGKARDWVWRSPTASCRSMGGHISAANHRDGRRRLHGRVAGRRRFETPVMIDETFLTTEEVLEYLQVNLRTVYRLIKAGKIPAVRVGRQWRFRKRDIDAWLDSQRMRAGTRTPAQQPTPAVRAPAGTTRPRVLVVDDEASIRDLLSKTLALAEYDIDVAPDGRSALERMRMYAYDLLIADLKMPGMDGLTLIREASASGRFAGAHHHRVLHRGECHRSGQPRVAGYLTKPFRVPQVLAAAAKALGE
jgi:excisionase family DNA binding protein